MPAPPAFLFPPMWDRQVDHTSSYSTQVLTADDGTEQRATIREAPAQSIRYTALLGNTAAVGALALLLAEAPTARVNLPRWFDATALTADLAPGATSIPCDTTDRGFVVGGQCVILSLGLGTSEVRTIAGLSAGAIDVTGDAVTLTWSSTGDVVVLPIAPARAVLPLDKTYIGGVVAELDVHFDWEVEAPPSASPSTAVPASLAIVGGYGWDPLGTLVLVFGGEYVVVRVQVFDADGLRIPDPESLASITWSSSDSHVTIEPIGPPRSTADPTLSGEIAVLRATTPVGVITATVTATLNTVPPVSGTLGVEVG